MGKEIEHKFLVKNDQWRNQVSGFVAIRQAYIRTKHQLSTVRVRIAGKQGWVTFKCATSGITRDEYEYPIPLNEALEMLKNLCDTEIIVKTRYFVKYDDKQWVVDIFEGRNAGLTIAELEVASEQESFSIPPWLGADVTSDHRYSNWALAITPYSEWPVQGTNDIS